MYSFGGENLRTMPQKITKARLKTPNYSLLNDAYSKAMQRLAVMSLEQKECCLVFFAHLLHLSNKYITYKE
jgi:hypothetical protein